MSNWLIDRYIEDVMSGRVPASRWTRAAVERHLNDLEVGERRGLWFDHDSVDRILKFFSILKHSKGEWAGQSIRLEAWQQFLLGVLFGWRRADGLRRFRTAYVSVARKNGKSTIGAGVGLYLFAGDQEPGAEVYSAATKRDQARITHAEAMRMVKSSPLLRKRVRTFKDNLHIEDTASKFEPLGADTDTLDGLNVHGAIIDELHAHKNRSMFDVLDTATGSRRQPLLFGITTAGFDRQSLCFQLDEYARKILDNIIEDDSFFGLIYTLDDDDDWQDERNWLKSNPNLGVSKKLDDIRRKFNTAREMPAAQNSFLRLELNVWTQSETKWLPLSDWQACGALTVDVAALRGRPCWAGLDLSSTSDLTAFVLVFPPASSNGVYAVIPRFFVPEENILKRARADRVPYDVWRKSGYLIATPGNVIDYDWVFAQIERDARQYDIREIAFDRWGAARVASELQKRGLTMVEFGQGFASMSPPMKDVEELIKKRRLAHMNHPVLTWCADNVVAVEDPAGNIKPDKSRSREKIDGFVAMLMALDRAMRNIGRVTSVYQTHGVRVL
jgi:phage terminase large subunit-like protein